MVGIFSLLSNATSGLSIMFLKPLWEGLLSLGIKLSMWVLGLIRPILRLIFNVARIDFFGEDIIGDLLGRVYMILGILMLFKITISCVQYLINPDKADDKENGFGGIIKRTIICVMLLALVKPIFNFAKEAQMAIIETLPKVILGTENGIDTDDITENIAYTTALGFFGYNEGCNNGKIGGLSGASSNALFNNIDDISKNSEIITSDKSCNGNSAYHFNGLCIFAAGFLVFILVSMAIDVGIRTIKFGFLQLIAPVPIASYIDPKTSKKSFDSWVHNSISVYVDLFIRLGVIYFILFLFKTIMSTFKGSYVLTGGETITGFDAGFVNVLIIIALFMFAKNAPKFICDVLGIKDSGSLTDMFKRAGGLWATPAAGLAAGIGSYRSKRQWGASRKSSLAGGLRAAAAGTLRGINSTAKGEKMSDVFKNSRNKARAAANKRYEFKNRGGNFKTRVTEGWDTFTGITTGAEQISKDKQFYQNMLSLKSNEKKNALAKVNSLSGLVDNHLSINATGEISTTSGRIYENYQEFKREYDSLNAIPAAQRTMTQQLRLTDLIADKAEVEEFTSQISVNGHVYKSYVDFLNEYNGLQQIPYDQRTATQNERLTQMATDKDRVEKVMIRNESFIALTKPSMDEGNYSAIAADVIKIARSGQPDDVNSFLKNIGGSGGLAAGQKILEKLTKHQALSREEAISLNDYIAGALESDAQKKISEAVERERTVPKS